MNKKEEKEFTEPTKTGTWPEVKGIPGDSDEEDEDEESCSSNKPE